MDIQPSPSLLRDLADDQVDTTSHQGGEAGKAPPEDQKGQSLHAAPEEQAPETAVYR